MNVFRFVNTSFSTYLKIKLMVYTQQKKNWPKFQNRQNTSRRQNNRKKFLHNYVIFKNMVDAKNTDFEKFDLTHFILELIKGIGLSRISQNLYFWHQPYF